MATSSIRQSFDARLQLSCFSALSHKLWTEPRGLRMFDPQQIKLTVNGRAYEDEPMPWKRFEPRPLKPLH